MAAEKTTDLNARLDKLENRIMDLEAADEIRNLKATYAAACDDNYNPDAIAALFVEDAVWESDGLGNFEGREAIREFFRGISSYFTFALHYGLNPKIEVAGDTARARWYLFMPCTVSASSTNNEGPGPVEGRHRRRRVREGRWPVDVQAQEIDDHLQHSLRRRLGQNPLFLTTESIEF